MECIACGEEQPVMFVEMTRWAGIVAFKAWWEANLHCRGATADDKVVLSLEHLAMRQVWDFGKF
jgi:hypothetical protein